MRLTYHPGARADLLEATRYYRRSGRELAERFSHDYDTAVRVILEEPERWPVAKRGIRRHLLGRFPYGIYYRVLEDEVRILAVHHQRRDPDRWRSRLDGTDNGPAGIER